ncbi:MAG: response regulator [Kiritimatiellae bacterium]|jgi:CheY-like chemotaxis protein|nr:response regulator [Kiritimatiellia bacterium]
MEKKNILLVDDDMSLLITLGDFLSFEGYNVVTANSGEQGLEKLKSYIPDIIILDMSMPGMGGIGFLDEISNKAGKPKYPVLVLTAKANMAAYFANVEVDGFIAKPCTPEDLLMEVGRIVFLRSGDTATGLEELLEQKNLQDKKILVVDSDSCFIDKISVGLDVDGAIVATVKDGPEMLERAILWEPDVVVASGLENDIDNNVATLHMMPKTKNLPVVIYNKKKKLSSSFDESKFVKYVELKNVADVITEVKSFL